MKDAQETIQAIKKLHCESSERRGEGWIFRGLDPRYGARDMFAYMMKEEHGWKEYMPASDVAFTHEGHRVLFSFNEGDFALIECPTLEAFKAELATWDRYYGVA
jgi:hypothetical protein